MQIVEARTNHHIIYITVESKFDMVIYWLMGKTSHKAKISLGDFQVTTLKKSLIKIKRLQAQEILPQTRSILKY